MTFLRTAALALPLHLALAAPLLADEPMTLDTDSEKLGYAFGLLTGGQMQRQLDEFNLDAKAVVSGISAAMKLDEPLMTLEEAETFLQAEVQRRQEEERAAAMAESAERIEAAKVFMEENAKKDGIVTTASGLQYKLVEQGSDGTPPTKTDTVVVHYTGRLLNGKVFDSSVERGTPATFPVGGVIAGWTEALQLMTPGTKFEVWLPADIAYGERGAGADIGPNETLNFDIHLIEVVGQ